MDYGSAPVRIVAALVIACGLFSLTSEARGGEAALKTKKALLAEAAAGVPQLSPVELKQKMNGKKNLILLDVRTERERAAGYIGGSVWIPRGVLEFKILDICEDPETEIVVYCRKGGRSVLAVQSLRQLGYRKVFNLEGGINAWGENGLSLYNWHGEIKVVHFDKQDPLLSTYDVFKK